MRSSCIAAGIPFAVRPGKTTELFVRLALEAGSMVRTELLIEDLWSEDAVGHGPQHAPSDRLPAAPLAG